MKYYIFPILISLLLSAKCIPLHALDISVQTATFQGEKSPYLEVYVYVVGSTAGYTTADSVHWQAGIEFLLMLSRPDSSIAAFDKFTLTGPLSESPVDFIDMKRISLPNGRYRLEITANDIHNPENTFRDARDVRIDFRPGLIQLSGIQLLSRFEADTGTNRAMVKNGYFLESAAFAFYPSTTGILPFYIEVYNPTAEIYQASYLRYGIYQKQGKKDSLIMQKFRKLEKKAVQPLILQLPVNELPSGNYDLVVELRNRDKLLVDATFASFQRSHPLLDLKEQYRDQSGFDGSFAMRLDEERVRYSLKALAPLTKGMQSSLLEQLLLEKDSEGQRYFLDSYFSGISTEYPERAYLEFMKVADAVDQAYRSNVGYGFETDRGMIFIKYGKPTEIVQVEDEPSAPPYEIWFYDYLDESRQFNIKFLFYNPSLANNDFVLLHSNCRGERYNPRWEVELYRHAPNEQVGTSSASTEMQENYRRDARKIWDEL